MAGKNNIKGITVEIGGDTTALDKALSQTGKQATSLGKELSIINKQLEFDPKNTTLLAQKQAVLTDAIKNSEERLKALRKEQEAVNEAFAKGDASAEEVRKVERQIIATERKLKDYRGELAGAGDDNAKFGEIAAKAGKAAAAGITAAVGAAAALIAALGKLTVGGAEYADGVLTQATVTGLSTQRLQEYQYAAELVDVSVDTLTGAMVHNIQSMESAREGTGDVAEAYRTLGVSVTDADGSLRDGQDVFNDVVDALGRVGNETERDALAMKIFGESAQKLNPLIEAGSGRLEELAAQARDVGYVLTDSQLTAYGALDDQIQTIKVNADAAGRALGMVLLPELTEITEAGADLIGDFAKRAAEGDTTEAAADLAEGLIDMALDAVDRLLDAAPDFVDGILEAAADRLIPKLIEAVPGLIDKLAQLIPVLFDNIVPLLSALIESLIKELPSIIVSLNASLIDVVLGIIEALIQLLFSGYKMKQGMIDDLFSKSGEDIMKAIGEGVMSRATELLGKIFGFGKRIGKAFREMLGLPTDEDPAEAGAVDVVRRSEVAVYSAQQREQESLSGKLDVLIGAVQDGKQIVLDGDKLVGGTVGRYDEALGQRAVLAKRGGGASM